MPAVLPRFVRVLALATVIVVPGALPLAAHAVESPQAQRAVRLTDRITSSSAPATAPGATKLLALPGEREGFQLALRNGTGAPLRLDARITGDAALTGGDPAFQVDLLRVGFITLPAGSTGMNTRGGSYADPLPELRPRAGAAGLLEIAPSRWGALAIIVRVRTTAGAGVRSGTVELYAGDTVYARQPFSVDVRVPYSRGGAAGHLLQPGESRQSMKTVLGIEADRYWLGNSEMRNGSYDRNAQLRGLYRFYDNYGFSPLNWANGSASASGDLDACAGATAQLASYLAPTRDIDPASTAFPARIMPMKTDGCRLDGTDDDYVPTRDIAGTPGAEQDDLLRPNAAAFWSRLAADWRSHGFVRPASTYMLNPFDEPSDATAAYRRTMNTQVPAATARQRAAGRGQVRVFLSAWPRDERRVSSCRRGSCLSFSRDTFGNRRMWDGKGLDDPNVWMVPFSRMFGRPNDHRTARVGYDRASEYRTRLAAIKRLRGGREVWGYNFHTATRAMPQLVIDAPGTDARLQYWVLARDGHTGLFVSNSMLGWSTQTRYAPGTRLRERGAPFAQATYFRHGTYGYGAGWGTFVYPPYEPSQGLVEERDRNTELSRPTSSLRFEGMRDGQEDANLIAMYRARFGAVRTNALMKPIFPGSTRPLPRKLGNVVFPTWRQAGLGTRMEQQRRAMILALAKRP